MTGHNEITGGRFESAVQAHTINGGVWINSGWTPRGRADAVTAWTGPRVDDCPARKSFGHHFHTVVVNNGSPQPIHDVTVSVPVPDAVLLPGEEPVLILPVGLVPPHAEAQVPIGDLGQFHPQFAVPLGVHFTDVDGAQWYRDEHSRLAPADAPAR